MTLKSLKVMAISVFFIQTQKKRECQNLVAMETSSHVIKQYHIK